jgi:type IV pilus assembly protein PilB
MGKILIEQGRITPGQLQEALDKQKESKQRLGDVLVDNGWVTKEELNEVQAVQYDVPYEPLAATVAREVIDLLPASVAQASKVLPVSLENGILNLAMANPIDFSTIDWIQVQTKLNVAPRFTPLARIERALAFYYGVAEESGQDELVETEVIGDRFSLEEVKRASEEPPVISLVNSILTDAIKARASDIHLEPGSNSFEVRFRIDGSLRRVKTIPKSMQAACISRVKIMAELDISERRLPQDGRMGLKLNQGHVDIRMSTLPTRHGERVVLRVLDRSKGILDLTQLGFSEHNFKRYESLINRPHGLVLLTGPTGSGKTTTLYASLLRLRSDSRNILTCEDPVEYELEGIGQSQVHERIGLTFAAQLRSALRQDPDIILVGEIRDQETAEIACRAAMTGHLVLSTLHTNDAASTIPRLIDIGIEPFLINSALVGAVAQRLVRRLCPDCKQEDLPTDEECRHFGLPKNSKIFRPVGCNNCNKTGYLGRLTILEVLSVDEEIQRHVIKRSQMSAIRKSAIAGGMVPIAQDAISKVLEGHTSLEEANAHIVMSAVLEEDVAA